MTTIQQDDTVYQDFEAGDIQLQSVSHNASEHPDNEHAATILTDRYLTVPQTTHTPTGSLFTNSQSESDDTHRPPSPQPLFDAPLLSENGKLDVTPEAEKSQPIIKNWPEGPIPLKHPIMLTTFSVIGDVLLLLIWLVLALFAITVARSDGQPRSIAYQKEWFLTQVTILVPTFFPIFFAGTVGRCIRLISMYRVEHGERIGTLDRLLGSTTLMGTLITASTMWSFSIPTFVLPILWTLSPLGIQYLSSNNSWNIPGEAIDRDSFITAPNAMFLSTLVSPRSSTNQPMDMWGNVKIPSIEAIAKANNRFMKQRPDGWYHLYTSIYTQDYSSLIGIPIQRPADDSWNAFSKLRLETSYWTLNCTKVGVRQSLNEQYTTSKDRLEDYWELEADESLKFNYTATPLSIFTSYRPQNISTQKYSQPFNPDAFYFLYKTGNKSSPIA
ncbi:hypothetical protein QBC38DRAFT_525679 [Podospora fimiseda]|uniref:Uncharacterized protein n=1 Tax=Podospora fimiseda TaxID=252190 RepID=A0AAN7BYF1_9PEZI|nr:hypothetical protein QBC38DRAFT_525679 [Podospora fimiseda]